MKNYKIIDVLSTFSRKEMRRFGEFVSSPYFNKNEPVIRLFEVLKPFHPDFRNKNLEIEKIFHKVFSKGKFNYHKINNVISDLYKLSEKFIAQIHAEDSEFFIERNILRELRKKQLYRIYEQIHSSYEKKLAVSEYKDENYFYRQYELNDEYLWYATIKKPNTELNILQTEFDHFIRFTLIRLLRFYNLMLHERNQNNVEYNLTLFSEILSYLEKNEHDIPVLKIFKTILFLLHTKEKKYYDELWKLKEEHFNRLKFDDAYLVYIHLYDYAAYMVNFRAEDSYNHDMFMIYKEMIDRSFMSRENFLYPNLMNIVKIACRIEEYEYAEKVIKDFGGAVPSDERENVMEFCYGTIENARGNLRAALKHFSKANFQNFIFKVQVKILLLKIYYRLEMFEEALRIIDSFKHFVTREENLLAEHKDSYMMFLNLMGELIKSRGITDKIEFEFSLQKLRKDCEQIPANPFRIKLWLAEEIKKLSVS